MELKLIKRNKIATGTYSFFFEPAKHINFTPGHFIYLYIPKLIFPDARGNMRHFSLCSTSVNSNLFEIVLRDGESGYKKTLKKLPIGSILEFEGPEGVYNWDNSLSGSHTFIAGGVGIAPFMSRIIYSSHVNHSVDITLYYSNKTKEDAPYHHYLSNNKFIKYFPIFTYYQARINKHLLLSHYSKYLDTTWWICGSPTMVDSVENILIDELGVDSSRVLTEKFTGY